MDAPLLIFTLLAEFALRLLLIAVIVVRGRGRPSARLTWIVVILAFPLVGGCFYLLVGEVRLGYRRRRRHAAILHLIDEADYRVVSAAAQPVALELCPEHVPIAQLAESVGHRPPRGGNLLDLVGDTHRFVDALVADIDGAELHCHLLFYIYLDDGVGRRVADALMRAAERGVVCRLLVDGVGSRPFLRSALRRRMEAGGVRVVDSLPARVFRMLLARLDLRNHRKIVVIDGVIGWTGSQNVADAAFAPKPRYAPWIDCMVRVQGPAARDLQRLFITDWYVEVPESADPTLNLLPGPEEHGVAVQVIGTGPGFYQEGLRQLVNSAIFAAREELILTTPYFVPDLGMLGALTTAARRGVEVSLVVPARNDSRLVAAASRSFYQMMLDCGMHVYEFREGLLHAKTITLDRSLALVTTGNLDRRSFDLNLESSIVVYDTDFASRLRFLQTSYLDRADRIDAGAWRRRPLSTRFVQNAVGTMAPLL